MGRRVEPSAPLGASPAERCDGRRRGLRESARLELGRERSKLLSLPRRQLVRPARELDEPSSLPRRQRLDMPMCEQRQLPEHNEPEERDMFDRAERVRSLPATPVADSRMRAHPLSGRHGGGGIEPPTQPLQRRNGDPARSRSLRCSGLYARSGERSGAAGVREVYLMGTGAQLGRPTGARGLSGRQPAASAGARSAAVVSIASGIVTTRCPSRSRMRRGPSIVRPAIRVVPGT